MLFFVRFDVGLGATVKTEALPIYGSRTFAADLKESLGG